jgi:hypothetical protein
VVDHYVNALCQCGNIGGVNGGEHTHAQLIPTQLAIAIGINDTIGAKDGADLVCINALKVNGAHNV